MKILHVVGDSKYGGASVLILRLVEAAINTGYDVAVLTTDQVFKEVLKKNGIEVIPLKCIWRTIHPIHDVCGLLRLTRYLLREKYQIIHTHTSKGGVIGRLAGWLANVPIIIHTVHGFAFHEQSNNFTVRCISLVERLVGLCCHKIVTVSHYHRDWALRLGIGNPKKTIAIPNGISPSRTRSTKSGKIVRQELGIADDEKLVLSMGRLAPQKGFEYLIRSCKRVHSSSRFKVVIIGDGPLRTDLEMLSKSLGLCDHVLFLGFRSDVGDLINAADLVTLPSLWEGLSIALLEAMSAGKPIITTDIGSNVEVTDAGHCARLVPTKDHILLAKAISDLLDNSQECERLGHLGYERFRALYTEERMLQSYVKMYQELTAHNSTGSE